MHRASYYYKPQSVDVHTLLLLKLVDEEYTRHPFYGTRRMSWYLTEQGYSVGRDRIRTLYQILGLEAIYPKPNLSKPNKAHKKFPYLLRNLPIKSPNQVWSIDITYLRLIRGLVYLVAIIDWYSRYVLDWELSTSLEATFYVSSPKSMAAY